MSEADGLQILDRLKPGDVIAINRWNTGNEDFTWVGAPLCVVVVESPWFVVENLMAPQSGRVPVDARRVAIQRVSPDYVQALKPKVLNVGPVAEAIQQCREPLAALMSAMEEFQNSLHRLVGGEE